MAHRQRERIGGVVGKREAFIELSARRTMAFTCALSGMPECGNGELHLVGRVLKECEAGVRRRQHHDRARLA